MSLLSRLLRVARGISAALPAVEIIIEALPRKRKRRGSTPDSSKTDAS